MLGIVLTKKQSLPLRTLQEEKVPEQSLEPGVQTREQSQKICIYGSDSLQLSLRPFSVSFCFYLIASLEPILCFSRPRDGSDYLNKQRE